jgi:hypothetical protein
MTESIVVKTQLIDSSEAGADLGRQLCTRFNDRPADAVIIFAAPRFDASTLLKAFHDASQCTCVVGCSTAGEFTNEGPAESSACAIALRSTDIRFTIAFGKGLRADREAAARQIIQRFRGLSESPEPYRYALILTDALAGYTEELMEHLTTLSGGAYQLFGGGAGDDDRFRRTQVFAGTEALSDAAVALEFISSKPLGIGVRHGWNVASDPMRVTEADGMRLISLNSVPAREVIEDYAQRTGQRFDTSDPIPFFLHNLIGIETGAGYKLRVPLSVQEDGSVVCAAEIPVGAVVNIMRSTGTSAAEAAASAAVDAMQHLQGRLPAAALFFDCAATRLRLGQEFGLELKEVSKVLGEAPYAGCNTYGQIARVEGQFSGFHNCTAVVCAIPE